MAKIPRIIRKGNDPDCVHHEHIDTSNIGRCWKCGRVADYNQVPVKDIDPASEAWYGDAPLAEVNPPKKKRRRRSQLAARGVANHYVGPGTKTRPESRPERQTVAIPGGNHPLAKKILVKGRDF